MKVFSLLILVFLVFPVACSLNEVCPDYPDETHEITAFTLSNEQVTDLSTDRSSVQFNLEFETEKIVKAKLGGMYSANAADFNSCADTGIILQNYIEQLEVTASTNIQNTRRGENIASLFFVENGQKPFNPTIDKELESTSMTFSLHDLNPALTEIQFTVTIKLDNARILQATTRKISLAN